MRQRPAPLALKPPLPLQAGFRPGTRNGGAGAETAGRGAGLSGPGRGAAARGSDSPARATSAGRKSRLDHAQNRVTARQVVPGDRIVGNQPDQPAIDLKRTRILSLGGEVVRRARATHRRRTDRARAPDRETRSRSRSGFARATAASRSRETGVPKTNRPDDPEVRPSQRAPSRRVITPSFTRQGTGR